MSLVNDIRVGNAIKLTGPPEHWVTTYKTGFWGLTEGYVKTWRDIGSGTIALFHSTNSNVVNKGASGIIGLGRVSKLSTKKSLEWMSEIKDGINGWPLLIHFDEYEWLSNELPSQMSTTEIIASGVMVREATNLTKGIIPFSDLVFTDEYRDRKQLIPAMRSISRIPEEKIRPLRSLLKQHLRSSYSVTAVQQEDIATRALTDNVATAISTSFVQGRVGQDAFSKAVRQNFNHSCCFPDCDVNDDAYLVGAHIERWSDNPEKRGSVANGLCLCLMHDKSFERGDFIIDDDYRVRVSDDASKRSSYVLTHLYPSTGARIGSSVIAIDKESLKYHRDRTKQ